MKGENWVRGRHPERSRLQSAPARCASGCQSAHPCFDAVQAHVPDVHPERRAAMAVASLAKGDDNLCANPVTDAARSRRGFVPFGGNLSGNARRDRPKTERTWISHENPETPSRNPDNNALGVEKNLYTVGFSVEIHPVLFLRRCRGSLTVCVGTTHPPAPKPAPGVAVVGLGLPRPSRAVSKQVHHPQFSACTRFNAIDRSIGDDRTAAIQSLPVPVDSPRMPSLTEHGLVTWCVAMTTIVA